MICPKCKCDTEALITNVQDNTEGCWRCVATGSLDNVNMLRLVGLRTDEGRIELHTCWAANNIEAMKRYWRHDVSSIRCQPLVN